MVDTTNDVVDGDATSISTLLANKGADGFISLREAVIASNNTSGNDTINLAAGTYTLTIAGAGDDSSATGDIDIQTNITIAGAGMASTIISGGGIDRVIEVDGTGNLTLSDVQAHRRLDQQRRRGLARRRGRRHGDPTASTSPATRSLAEAASAAASTMSAP